MQEKINIVLYEPEIPQNTGNIMRTCVGTGALLHLIKPLGFKIDEAKLKRSAVDYFDHIQYKIYENWEEFLNKNSNGSFYFLTRYGRKPISNISFEKETKNIYLIYGSESKGIKKEILKENIDNCFRIPTNDKIRSLNLSNAVAITLYEVLRQLDYPNLSYEEPEIYKGNTYLLQDEEENK